LSVTSSSRRAADSLRRLNLIEFGVATLVAAVVLVSIVAIPQWLSKQARWDMLRSHVGEVGQLAASVVDGDLHRKLLDPKNYTKELYDRALAPLVRFHSADPDIFYVYTMVDRGGVPYFALDTAASPDLRTKHQLRASEYMEKFELDEDDDGQWLKDIASGKTYVNPDFETDDYGDFLSAHAPIYDSQGRYSGFVGVDFDLQYYLAQEARFRKIAIGTLAGALLLAVVIGYLVTIYHASVRRRIEDLYASTIRDGLTGLLNRRGVMDRVKKALERYAGKSALLLIDIDNLKMINDLRGQAIGDVVIAYVADAVRWGAREGDACARFGGDEFLVVALGCDADEAAAIAKRILRRTAGHEMPLSGARFSLSVGIATHDGKGAEFARLYRQADAALQKARAEGRNRVAVFDPSALYARALNNSLESAS